MSSDFCGLDRLIDKSSVVPRLKTYWPFDLTAKSGDGVGLSLKYGGAQQPVISGSSNSVPQFLCQK